MHASGDDARPLVLVTGSSGFLGAQLCAELGSDHRVVGLDLAPPGPDADAGCGWVECDLTQDASVREALSIVGRRWGTSVASVLHLAAYYDFSGEPSHLYDELTVEGTRRLLRELRAGFAVEQVVFSSSLLAMKPVEPGEVLDETSPTEGAWDYPRSKLEAERVLREERGDLPVVVLRIAGVYDEMTSSPPIAQHLRRIHERQLESYFFPGDPERGQAFVHVEDVARLVRRVVEERGRLVPEELFLVGEPDVMAYEELQDQLGRLLHGKEWPTIRVPAPLAKVGAWVRDKLDEDTFIKPWMVDLADAHRPVSIDRARTVLGWEPRHRLRGTLAPMVRALQEDPRGWYEHNDLPLPPELEREGAPRREEAPR